MTLRIAPVPPADLDAAIPHLAALRIEVFRDFPYLYDGDVAYEAAYLESYRASPGALVVGAWTGARLVGAATGTPLEDHAEAFGAPFRDLGWRLEDVFYCAESVLLPGWRGQGAGHSFFDLREAHARVLGRTHVVFCAVDRGRDHPARPAGYRPLDSFWRARGYRPLDGVETRFSWRDIAPGGGRAPETEKRMVFWHRRL